MKLLCNAENEHELCAYSLTPLDGTMQFDIATISKMLAPGVGDVVARIFTEPADFHKEFTAVHTWQSVARKQAAAAYEVLPTLYPIQAVSSLNDYPQLLTVLLSAILADRLFWGYRFSPLPYKACVSP